MYRDWTAVLNVLSATGLSVSAGLPDITGIAAQTCYFIHNPALLHLLDLWFQRRQCGRQFSESHSGHTWCSTVMEDLCIVLCTFSPVLVKEGIFNFIGDVDGLLSCCIFFPSRIIFKVLLSIGS